MIKFVVRLFKNLKSEKMKFSAPFSLLSKQETIADLIEYVHCELKIEKIKFYVREQDLTEETLNTGRNPIVNRFELDKPIPHLLQNYLAPIKLRLETLIEAPILGWMASNSKRYNYLAKQVIRTEELMDQYIILYPFSDHITDLKIVVVFKGNEYPYNVINLKLTGDQNQALYTEFGTRYLIFKNICQIILKKALDYGDMIEDKSNDYSWIQEHTKDNPGYEIYELAFALANSKKFDAKNGKDEITFIREFLHFFNLPPDGIPKYKGWLSDRKIDNPAPFLEELIENIKKSKPTSKRSKGGK